MSASSKKKLRKEQNAATMTEKQQNANKDAKKLKAYTISFIVVMVLVIGIVLGSVLKAPVNGIINNNTHAVTIGERELNSVTLNYFYVDKLLDFYNDYYETYASYGEEYVDMFISMATGLNTYSPLNEQVHDKETGETWDQYMIAEAIKTARWTYATYDLAMSKGFKLPEDAQEVFDKFGEVMASHAKAFGYSNSDSYLRGMYGAGSNVSSFKEYYRISLVANAYANEYFDSLEYTDEQFREYEAEKYHEYSSYTFASYYIPVKDFLTGGTTVKGEDGKTTTTYTDEQKAAAEKAAKELAESLAVEKNNTVAKLNAALKNWAQSVDEKKEAPTVTESNNILYSNVGNMFYTEDVSKWLLDEKRTENEITCIPYTTEDEDGKKTVNGYYVVIYLEENTNDYLMPNIRYALIAFQNGKQDEATGEITYTDDEKKSKKEFAQKMLDEWRKKDKTDEESFISFVKLASDDKTTKADGGLAENINNDSNFDDSVIEWCLQSHKVGETGIVEAEHGYYIIFFADKGDDTYRDGMLHAEMASNDYADWSDERIESVKLTEHNLDRLDREIIIANRF